MTVKPAETIAWRISDTPVAYPAAVAAMEARAAEIADSHAGELVWLLEHPPLYTAGTSAKTTDLLAPARFPVFDRLGREIMSIAKARGITPLGFNGFDPSAFAPGAPESASRASIAQLAEFNRPGAKTHSGIWRDLAVRKRRTEVGPQIAFTATLGRETGVPTPALTRLAELIVDIEDGRRPQSRATFEELNATCRSVSTAASPS